SMLNAGTYTVTVTDDDGCSVIESASLFAPAPLDITVTVTPPDCPSDNDGLITFTNISSTDLTFEWFNGNTMTQQAAGLTCGNSYSVTISDINLCETIVIDTFMECPEQIDANLDTIPTPLTSCHLSNSVLCDAQLTAIPSGGTAGTGVYSMTWSSGESFTDVTSATATGLCQGLQYVIIGDANCSDTTFFTVNSPPPLTFDLGQLGSTPPSCFGDSNGTAMVGATGGTPGYSFLWDDGTVGETIGGLTSGNYNVTVTDANGCSNDISIGVSENPLLVAQILDFIDPSCAGGDDGQITVGQTGGVVGAFNYNWSPNSDDNNSLAANLTSGNYSITVTDANGCTSEVSQALSEPTPIDAVIPMPVEPICNGGQTVITVESATGGASLSHTFSVDFGPPQFLTSSIPVLAGEHLIQVFDSLGCFTEYTITIDEPNQVVVAFENDIEELELGDSIRLTPVVIPSPNVPIDTLIWSPFTDLSCAIFNNDSICQYVWASPLETTTYELIAIDTNGCEARAEVTVDIDRNRNVYIPNAFSPDGNGVNDILKIFTGVGVERINYFRIYDRWGEQVYAMNDFVSSDNPLEGWDGRMNGKDMNSGIYVYIAEVVFADGRVLLYRGDVALVR
ncbi:MAG: gliding motility-associated C-terminal domain-containing protein, partial [Saprospiraceae bacterium]